MSNFQPSELSDYGDAGAKDAGSAARSGYSTTESGPKTSNNSASIMAGTFHDSSGYSYDLSASRIVIYKKDGSIWKAITPSDSSWDTVVNNLAKDIAAGRASAGKATPQAKHASYTPSSTPAVSAETETDAVPFYKASWFPYAVGGTVLVIGIGAILFWPSKKSSPQHSSHASRQRLAEDEYERGPRHEREHEPEYDEESGREMVRANPA